jgi:flagellar biosynthesis/type III secretory pathway protein FliH
MEKMTNVKALNYVLANCELTDEVRAKIENMKTQFEKKNSAEKKPTANQVANKGIQDAILEGMQNGKLYTITDMIKEIPACADLTNQKVSALIRPLIGVSIERVVDKRKAYFRKIG